jgi:2'-5' RNA ligase
MASSNNDEVQDFRNLRSLTNHWARPIEPPAYYWYLTFEHSPELQAAAAWCQQAISFPYFDLTPVSDLHLTLDRVAFEGELAGGQLAAIEAAARQACRNIARFEMTVSLLGGVSGAIGFTAFPEPPIRELKDTLRAATLSAYPYAQVRQSRFHPHVAIAYANSDGILAAEVIAAVDKLNASAQRVDLAVDHITLVLLERRPRSYAWRAISRIPLTGGFSGL